MPNNQIKSLTFNGVTYDIVDETSGYAKLASPTFTGTPTAPTPTSGDDSTKIATTAFVQDAMSSAGTGTITKVKTTAGAHTTIDVSSGAAQFNVPTNTSHLTNDSGFITVDEKVKTDLIPSTSATYYLTLSSSESSQTGTLLKASELSAYYNSGSMLKLMLGKSNIAGRIRLYSTGTTYAELGANGSLTANRTLTIPDQTGTIALTSDIPDVSGKIDTAGTGLSKSGTTLNHSNSITAKTTSAVYPIKIDAQGHISEAGSAVTIVNTRGTAASGGTTLSVVNTGDMYTWNNKQDTLVSGTNIKTINSTSLLGSGNISIPSGMEAFVVFATYNSSTQTWSANKTFTEIDQAFTDGKYVYLYDSKDALFANLAQLTSDTVSFSNIETQTSKTYLIIDDYDELFVSQVIIPNNSYATNTNRGMVRPWYYHSAASTGPTAGSNSTAVAVNSISTTAGKYYAVESDVNGRMFVNVPWEGSSGGLEAFKITLSYDEQEDSFSIDKTAAEVIAALQANKYVYLIDATQVFSMHEMVIAPCYAGDLSEQPEVWTIEFYSRIVSENYTLADIRYYIQIDEDMIYIDVHPLVQNRKFPVQNGYDLSLVYTGDMYNWNNKQNALVSGTNIKTINNTSLLGSGNIAATLVQIVDWTQTQPVSGGSND